MKNNESRKVEFSKNELLLVVVWGYGNMNYRERQSRSFTLNDSENNTRGGGAVTTAAKTLPISTQGELLGSFFLEVEILKEESIDDFFKDKI
jgi:hypothetical protein